MSDLVRDHCSTDRSDLIGSGGSALVRKVRDPATGNWVAVKLIHPERFNEPRFIEEVDALVKLNHPCVLRIVGWVPPIGRSGPEIHTEIAEHGSLDRLMEQVRRGASLPFSTATGKAILISGIALGMRFVHWKHYIHGDLKPSNILVNARGQSLISDFGTVRSESYDMTMTPEGGSVFYAAPELFEEGKPCTSKIDVFAFGSIVYELLTGRAVFPRPNTTPFAVIGVLRSGEIPLDLSSCGRFMADLIRKCLSIDPENRPTFASIIDSFASADFDIVPGASPSAVGAYVRGVCQWERHPDNST
jgi:serine/threonine-protein kinase